MVPRGEMATVEMAFGLPVESRRVPSMGVDSDIDLGAIAGADFFAVVQHGSFVFFAFANYDDAADFDGVEDKAHGIHGGFVGCVFVATAHLTGGG